MGEQQPVPYPTPLAQIQTQTQAKTKSDHNHFRASHQPWLRRWVLQYLRVLKRLREAHRPEAIQLAKAHLKKRKTGVRPTDQRDHKTAWEHPRLPGDAETVPNLQRPDDRHREVIPNFPEILRAEPGVNDEGERWIIIIHNIITIKHGLAAEEHVALY